MTKRELLLEVGRLEQALAAQEQETDELSEELRHDAEIIEELHKAVEELSLRKDPEPEELARKVHDFLFDEGLAPDPWRITSTEWRRKLLELAGALAAEPTLVADHPEERPRAADGAR